MKIPLNHARLLAIKEAFGDHLDGAYDEFRLISAESLVAEHHTPLFSARWTSEVTTGEKETSEAQW